MEESDTMIDMTQNSPMSSERQTQKTKTPVKKEDD